MKTNLANFPNPNSRELQSNATFAVACIHWKEAFVKELREELAREEEARRIAAKILDDQLFAFHDVKVTVFREVLGE